MKSRASIVGLSAVTVLLCFGLLWSNGADWRIPDSRIYPSGKSMRIQESDFCDERHKFDLTKLGGTPGEPIVTCSNKAGSNNDLYVWGDSHARHLVAGLRESFPSVNIKILYYTNCMAQNGIGSFVDNFDGKGAVAAGCQERNRRALRHLSKAKPSSIILHQYSGYDGEFSKPWDEATNELLQKLQSYGHHVVILGGVVYPGIPLADCMMVPSTITNEQIANRCKGSDKDVASVRTANHTLAEKFPDNYVDTMEFFCGLQNRCKWVDEGQLLFRDEHHLSLYGSRKLIEFVRPQLKQKLGL